MKAIRDGRAILVLALVVHALFLASLRGQFLNPFFCEAESSIGQAGDYFGIYTAGDQLLHGYSIYDSEDYRDEAVRRVPYYYFFRYLPPTAYVAALAALALPPWSAYVLWILVNESLLALAVVSILRMRWVALPLRRLLAALWIGFSPFYIEQWMGQFSFLMAAFLWVVFRQLLHGPDGAPGDRDAPPRRWGLVAWAASVALKSYPALFAASLLRRGRIKSVALCAAAVALVCAPYYLARPADLRQFLKLNMGELPPEILDGALGAGSLVRFLGWSLPEGIKSIRLDLGVQDVYLGNLPVYLWLAAVVAVTLGIVARRGRAIPLGLQYALWTLAFFIFFKEIWEYHYVMLLPVITYLALTTGEARRKSVLLLGLWLALPTPYIAFAGRDGQMEWAGKLVHHAWKAVPAVALYVLAAREALTYGVRRLSSRSIPDPPSTRP